MEKERAKELDHYKKELKRFCAHLFQKEELDMEDIQNLWAESFKDWANDFEDLILIRNAEIDMRSEILDYIDGMNMSYYHAFCGKDGRSYFNPELDKILNFTVDCFISNVKAILMDEYVNSDQVQICKKQDKDAAVE